MSILEKTFDLSQFDEYREDNRREVKKAEGGLPVSLWDTYSSFANCYDDIEQQYELIKTLKSFGETGIIVFYVGYILPAIDRRLIDLANDLDFVIIMMPEGRR